MSSEDVDGLKFTIGRQRIATESGAEFTWFGQLLELKGGCTIFHMG